LTSFPDFLILTSFFNQLDLIVLNFEYPVDFEVELWLRPGELLMRKKFPHTFCVQLFTYY